MITKKDAGSNRQKLNNGTHQWRNRRKVANNYKILEHNYAKLELLKNKF